MTPVVDELAVHLVGFGVEIAVHLSQQLVAVERERGAAARTDAAVASRLTYFIVSS
jgi:hypothetical protein